MAESQSQEPLSQRVDDNDSVMLVWPQSAVLEALLAGDLLGPWLAHAVEAAVLAPWPPALSQPDSLGALVRPWLPSEQASWPQWCEERGIDVDCLAPAIQRRDALAGWKHAHFADAAHQKFLELGPLLDQVCFSILQTRDVYLAQEWYFKLRESDVSFDDLALQSLGEEKRHGGHLGPIRMQDIQSPLDRLLARAKPGQIQPPLRIPSGNSIVLRLDWRQPAQWDDQTRNEWINGFHRRWLGEVIKQLQQRQPLPGAVCSIPLP